MHSDYCNTLHSSTKLSFACWIYDGTAIQQWKDHKTQNYPYATSTVFCKYFAYMCGCVQARAAASSVHADSSQESAGRCVIPAQDERGLVVGWERPPPAHTFSPETVSGRTTLAPASGRPGLLCSPCCDIPTDQTNSQSRYHNTAKQADVNDFVIFNISSPHPHRSRW